MNYKYDGITGEAILLLSENKFRDSRDFYEQNKDKIKAGIVEPLRQLAEIAGTELLSVDEHVNAVPTKMVSRVRRDTRFSNNKRLYRDNMWVMFMRDRNEWPQYPCMWFEFFSDRYSMGVGLFAETPAYMECFRNALRESPEEFRLAVKSAEKVGAAVCGESYKKPRADCPEGLEDYYNRKSFWLVRTSSEMSHLADNRVVDELLNCQKAYTPLYQFLMKVSDKFLSESKVL